MIEGWIWYHELSSDYALGCVTTQSGLNKKNTFQRTRFTNLFTLLISWMLYSFLSEMGMLLVDTPKFFCSIVEARALSITSTEGWESIVWLWVYLKCIGNVFSRSPLLGRVLTEHLGAVYLIRQKIWEDIYLLQSFVLPLFRININLTLKLYNSHHYNK